MKPDGMRCEVLSAEGTFNLRDLGGYIGVDGKPIRHRRFLRSGSLSYLTAKGEEELLAHGVGCIIDLRSRLEAKNEPDTLEADERVDYLHVPMLDYIQSNLASGDIESFAASMLEMYCGILDASQQGFGEVFDAFADPKYETVLFHCTAGKDRTGVTAMLLLLLGGVSEDDVVEDYHWSDQMIAPLTKAEDGTELPGYLFASAPETMRGAIRYLNETHGGVDAYLARAGLTSEKKRAILNKLFD